MKRDRQVRRDRPGRGRPDQDRDVRPASAGDARRVRIADGCTGTRHRSRASVRRVLDLGLGQRGPAVDAPVDRLFPLDRPSRARRTSGSSRDCGFVRVVHGQVGVLPVAEDAQPLEILRCRSMNFLGVGAAGSRGNRQRTSRASSARARGPPAVRSAGHGSPSPARRARRTRPSTRLDDQVLEDLVERWPRWIWPLA